MTRYWLSGYGRLPWRQACLLLTDSTCLWADLDGLHQEPTQSLNQDKPPIATHLWAWRDQQLWRLRIDGTDAISARLDLTDTAPDHEPKPQLVDVTESHTRTWPHREHRVAVDTPWRSRTMILYEVAGLAPLTFVRLAPSR